jgi:hypothetical protein
MAGEMSETPQELQLLNAEAAQIKENYGLCSLYPHPCDCIRRRFWLGIKCPHWKPVKANNMQELAEELKAYATAQGNNAPEDDPQPA